MSSKRPPLTFGGHPITDELVNRAAEVAEKGFDSERLAPRRGGRPLLGAAPASNISVRFPPEIREMLKQRARNIHSTEAELIRRAVTDYLERTKAG